MISSSIQASRPLLLVHGLNETGDIFNDWRRFFPDASLFMPDFPPFGETGSISLPDYRMSDYAQWFEGYLVQHGFAEVDWVGHSMGGYIGLEMLRQFPHRIRKLVLLNSTIEADAPERKDNRNRTIGLLQERPDTYYREFLGVLFRQGSPWPHHVKGQKLAQQMRKVPVSALQQVIAGLRDRPDYTGLAKKNAEKILWLSGDHDLIFPADQQKALANALGISWKNLPNAGHMGPWEDAEHAARFIREFLLQF